MSLTRSPGPPELRIEPALALDRAKALRLLFRQCPAFDRSRRVSSALKLFDRGELPNEGLLVACYGDRLVGALFCIPTAGSCGLVWPPQSPAAQARELIEDRLLAEARRWLKSRGARIGQAILTPAELSSAGALLRAGFCEITELAYMRHSLANLAPPGVALRTQSFEECDRAAFADALLSTYEGSLDCPEVNGLRSVHEILEGHKAQGVFDPDRWRLACDATGPAGVLLLTRVLESDDWDLSYLGVVAAKRRRGYGEELARRALKMARAGGARQLTLAVDVRNAPAKNLYHRLGFEISENRVVYLAFWDEASAGENKSLQPTLGDSDRLA